MMRFRSIFDRIMSIIAHDVVEFNPHLTNMKGDQYENH